MWTEEQNAQLLRRMDVAGDSQVPEVEFVHCCEQSLPKDAGVFEALVSTYIRVAERRWASASATEALSF